MMRSRQLQMKPVDLLTVVNDAVALVAHDMRARQVEVSVSVPASSGEISGDPVLLQQVFVILMMNAMDAMAPSPPDQRHIQISAEVSRASIEVSVRDTGPGLPEDLISRLFTPFLTTKPHGLGIGLAIARSLVDAHGGSITARNNPEGGAIFIVTLRTSKKHELLPGSPVNAGAVGRSPNA